MKLSLFFLFILSMLKFQVKSSQRSYVPELLQFQSIFQYNDITKDTRNYMAYEKDIALVNFYFDSSTVIQYR